MSRPSRALYGLSFIDQLRAIKGQLRGITHKFSSFKVLVIVNHFLKKFSFLGLLPRFYPKSLFYIIGPLARARVVCSINYINYVLCPFPYFQLC